MTAIYQRLGPLLADEGAFFTHWRLQRNLTPEEFNAVSLG